jgi:hypothetical protein
MRYYFYNQKKSKRTLETHLGMGARLSCSLAAPGQASFLSRSSNDPQVACFEGLHFPPWGSSVSLLANQATEETPRNGRLAVSTLDSLKAMTIGPTAYGRCWYCHLADGETGSERL